MPHQIDASFPISELRTTEGCLTFQVPQAHFGSLDILLPSLKERSKAMPNDSQSFVALRPMFNELRGPRVLVRSYELADAPQRFEAMEESREHIRRWDPDDAEVCRSLDDTTDWIVRKTAQWSLRQAFSMGFWSQDTNRYLGGIGLHLRQPGGWAVPAFSIGYWVRPSEQGLGYVTEAVGLVVDYALNVLEAQRIEIVCDPENIRSASIPQRLGFQLEGRVRNIYRHPDGRLCDELIFGLTPTDRRMQTTGSV